MITVAVWLLAMIGSAGVGIADHGKDQGSLLGKIEEGREKLKNESVQLVMGTVGTRRVRIGRRKYKDIPITGIVAREMAIAVLDGDGKIRIARAIKRDPGFEVLTPGFVLSMRRENGIR